MAQRLIMTDGSTTKNLNPADERYPEAWTWLSGAPSSEKAELFARVAAAYAAYHLTAETVASIPFVLKKGETEFDRTSNWQNACGFLPNPSELLRMNVLSLLDSNTVYVLKTTDALGYRAKGLYPLVPTTMTPVIDYASGQLRSIDRRSGGISESFTPDDPRLIRMWRLDHTTELLPSKNTDAKAMMNAAGIIYYADAWIEHFFRRGGIKPVLISMKGLVSAEKKDDAEKSWSNFLRGLGGWTHKVARIFNAESISVQQFGSGVDDLKDSTVYDQALHNVAIACRIPISLLRADSANFATAMEERATWYENKLIPLCQWLAYEYNRQLWTPLGLHMEFLPETLDPQQEDETERANAISVFMDFLLKCPSEEIALGSAETFGYELSESLIKAIHAHFEAKKTRQELAAQGQIAAAGAAGSGSNVEQLPAIDQGVDVRPVAPRARIVEPDAPTRSLPWMPTLDEYRELRVWEDVAIRRLRRGEGMAFDYVPHYGGLPAEIVESVRSQLLTCKSLDEVKQVFTHAISQGRTPADLVEGFELVRALNRLADALPAVSS